MCPRDFCGRLLSSRTCARRRTKPVLTKRLQCFKEWSTESRWQDRIAPTVTERGMQQLAQASEMDIETFFATWRGYLRRLTARDIETMPQGGRSPGLATLLC